MASKRRNTARKFIIAYVVWIVGVLTTFALFPSALTFLIALIGGIIASARLSYWLSIARNTKGGPVMTSIPQNRTIPAKQIQNSNTETQFTANFGH